MFEQTFVQTQAKTRKPWTVAASLTIQCGIVAVILLIPLLRPATMQIPEVPKLRNIQTWVNLATTPKPVPASSSVHTSALRSPGRQMVFYPSPPHPESRHVDVSIVDDGAPAVWAGPSTGFAAMLPVGNGNLPPAPPKPSPAPVKPAVPTGPVRIGGDIVSARLKFNPRPAYPQIAITTHTQGTVRLEAVIAADGSIRNLHVLSGPPLLVRAALDAVAQWKYEPTLLNGVAVEVLTTIDVNFALAH